MYLTNIPRDPPKTKVTVAVIGSHREAMTHRIQGHTTVIFKRSPLVYAHIILFLKMLQQRNLRVRGMVHSAHVQDVRKRLYFFFQNSIISHNVR